MKEKIRHQCFLIGSAPGRQGINVSIMFEPTTENANFSVALSIFLEKLYDLQISFGLNREPFSMSDMDTTPSLGFKWLSPKDAAAMMEVQRDYWSK